MPPAAVETGGSSLASSLTSPIAAAATVGAASPPVSATATVTAAVTGLTQTKPRSAAAEDATVAVATTSRQDKQSVDYVVKSLMAGGIAGCVAKTAIAPLDRVKILFQARSPHFLHLRGSITGAFRAMGYIHAGEGLRGLFRGNTATIARIFPYAALQYMSYEQFKLLLNAPDNEKAYTRLVAGSLAGMVSVLGTYPLDLMRARIAFEYKQQPRSLARTLVNTFHNHGGIVGLYRGLFPTILGIVPYAGVSFFTYDTLKATITQWGEEKNSKLSTPVRLLCGALAGACAQTVSYPLDVVRRRMQVHGLPGAETPEYTTFLRALRHIYQEGGIRALYTGLTINYVKVAPAVGLSFVTYEYIKGQLRI